MRREADQLFRQNEIEKNICRRHEADHLKNFHIDQYVSLIETKNVKKIPKNYTVFIIDPNVWFQLIHCSLNFSFHFI